MYQTIKALRLRWLFPAALCALSFGAPTRGAEPEKEALIGVWQGDLVVNPSTRVTIQLAVTRDAHNTYAAVLNAPKDAELQDIPVTSVSVSGDKVVFVVDAVGGRYEGTLQEHKLTGKWQQNGGSFDLSMAPYVKSRIPAATAENLRGPWHAVLSFPKSGVKIPIVVDFKIDPGAPSGMSATLDSPDQGAFGIPAEAVSLEDGELSATWPRQKMGLSAKVEGNNIVGRWIESGSVPLILTKGQYVAVGLDVPEPIRHQLSGNWYGEVAGGIGVALRFEEQPHGKLSGFLDSPYEGRRGIRLDRIDVAGSRISLGASAADITFSGTLTTAAINGNLVASGRDRGNVTLKRGDYIPQPLHVAADAASPLLGQWTGKTVDKTDVVLRFQRGERGDLIASEDIPDRQLFSMPVTGFAFDGQSLKLTVRGIAAEFSGKLVNNEISGDWTLPNGRFPLRLTRSDR